MSITGHVSRHALPICPRADGGAASEIKRQRLGDTTLQAVVIQ